MNDNIYSLDNFDFLTRSFARMQAGGHPINIRAITGSMDEGHHSWFCKHYTLYYQQATGTRKLELEH